MRVYSPADIERYGGPAPDRLRDWRRREFLIGTGVCRLPDGGLTADADHPELTGTERWAYRIEDVIALFVAREISDCGLILRPAFRIARQIAPLIRAWVLASARDEAQPDLRYLITYPGMATANPDDPEVPVYGITLEKLAQFPRPATFLIDAREIADRLSRELRATIVADAA